MKLTSYLIFILLVCACINTRPEAPERLPIIPQEAFWIGGADGGNWYVVHDIRKHRNNANISVYGDQAGELIVSKRFILICPENTETFITDLKEQIIAFDGRRILLEAEVGEKNCWLQ